MIVKGKTGSGFEFEIDKECLEDAQFMELYRKQEKNGLDLYEFIEYAIGKKQKEKLYDHVRGENGRVSIAKLRDEVGDILLALADNSETKN